MKARLGKLKQWWQDINELDYPASKKEWHYDADRQIFTAQTKKYAFTLIAPQQGQQAFRWWHAKEYHYHPNDHIIGRIYEANSPLTKLLRTGEVALVKKRYDCFIIEYDKYRITGRSLWEAYNAFTRNYQQYRNRTTHTA